MFYSFLADVVVAIHLAYVGYVVVFELLIVVGIPFNWQWTRNIWLRGLHLLMILIVAAEALLGITCPLTTWESQLLDAAGLPHEERSFIGRLMHDVFIYDCPADNNWIWPWVYGGAAALVLLTLIVAPPRCRPREGHLKKVE